MRARTTARTTARAALAALALALVGSTAVVAPAAAEGSCAGPTVNVLVRAEAAVSRPALRSPQEYALSNVYASVDLATRPQFVYAEAGPQYAGAFEALAPAGSPPPPRSVAAHPSPDIPDDHTEDWGGTSRTSVTPTSGSAASTGSRDLGIPGLRAASSSSFATTVVECDVVTVVAGWQASGVVLGPGASVDSMTETVTLVVGPDGASADVEAEVSGAEGVTVIPLEGRPADPVTDPIREGGGPRVEAGEPRTETRDGYAAATGGGFTLVFTDPEAGSGAAYSIGATNAEIDVLGALEASPADGGAGSVEQAAPPVTADERPAPRPAVVPASASPSSATGTPPAPSRRATEEIAVALLDDAEVFLLTVRSRTWSPLAGLVGTVVLAGALAGAVAVGRHRFPTLEWIARRTVRGSRRFSTTYLRW